MPPPGNDKEDTANAEVGQEDVDPDVGRHGVQEGEEAAVGGVWFAVQDADTGVEERLGEVDHLLTHVGDGERSHGQISSLWRGHTKKCYYYESTISKSVVSFPVSQASSKVFQRWDVKIKNYRS